jgi:uncharacterized protein
MKQALWALGTGALFGAGLVLSGLADPERVIGFLDIFGNWDKTLLFVMASAVSVHFLAYRAIRRRSAPLYGQSFAIPSRTVIDPKLVGGALVFGIGWGLTGYCPGPSVVALASGRAGVLLFVVAFVLGLFITGKLESAFAANRPARTLESSGMADAE